MEIDKLIAVGSVLGLAGAGSLAKLACFIYENFVTTVTSNHEYQHIFRDMLCAADLLCKISKKLFM